MIWTLPAPVIPTPPPAPALGRTLGFAGDFEVLPDGSLRTAEGRECLEQALQMRLVTSPGEYRVRPSYGAGLRAEVKRAQTRQTLDRLRARILEQVRADDRVRDVPAVSVGRIERGIRIRLTLSVLGEIVTLRPLEVS